MTRPTGPARGQRNLPSRVLEALSWLVEHGGARVSVREMATALGLPPSGAHRVLAALCEGGLVQQEADKRYALSAELYRLAHIATGRAPVERAALPHMRELVAHCNETVVLGVYDAQRRALSFAAAVESNQPLRYALRMDSWMPLHAGASGLAILAFLPADVQAEVLTERLPAVTGDTILDAQRLAEELQRVKSQGYAISRGQRIPDAVGLAAPVFGATGEVIGDIVLTIPATRFDATREGELAAQLMSCAARISSDLGAGPGNPPASYAPPL